ncbi:MAG: response regulator transcription factor [Eubacteriales bacterium]|nr:response regulator transcription factor [Eubacteriales bacterium]
MRLLIIEDEEKLAKMLSQGLKPYGYAVDMAFDGAGGEQRAAEVDYDAILLDLNLPDRDGLQVCSNLRENGCTSPILMLTARSSVTDRTKGLDIGADDYLIKPFALDELRARIQALQRRRYGMSQSVMSIGALQINSSKHLAFYNNKMLEITYREFDILEYIGCNYPGIVSIENILEHVWTGELDPFSNVARVHLVNLKRKLENAAGKSLIENVKGLGYRLVE